MNSRPVPIIDTITRVLGGIQAALGALAATAVITDLHEAIPVVLGVTIGVVGAVQIGLRSAAQSQAVPAADVVEVRDGGRVLAGPANDKIVPGGFVRPIGYEPKHRVAD